MSGWQIPAAVDGVRRTEAGLVARFPVAVSDEQAYPEHLPLVTFVKQGRYSGTEQLTAASEVEIDAQSITTCGMRPLRIRRRRWGTVRATAGIH